MPQLPWDASALVKRYTDEVGSETVETLFNAASDSMVITYMGYAETNAILRRNFNRGQISRQVFQQARILLQSEVLAAPGFGLLSVDDADILSGIALTDRHNINSTDAAILAAFLSYAQAQPPASPAPRLLANP